MQNSTWTLLLSVGISSDGISKTSCDGDVSGCSKSGANLKDHVQGERLLMPRDKHLSQKVDQISELSMDEAQW